MGEQVKFHLCLQTLPIACITAWILPLVRSVAAWASRRSVNSVDCTLTGSVSQAPYENHHRTIPLSPLTNLWKNCPPRNWSLVPKRLGTTGFLNYSGRTHGIKLLKLTTYIWKPVLLEISGEITSERMKRWSQSKNNTHLWMGLVTEARFSAVKSHIA